MLSYLQKLYLRVFNCCTLRFLRVSLLKLKIFLELEKVLNYALVRLNGYSFKDLRFLKIQKAFGNHAKFVPDYRDVCVIDMNKLHQSLDQADQGALVIKI